MVGVSLRGEIVSVNLSKGGLPKLPVGSGAAGALGIEGDVQRDRRYHGGPLKALLLASDEDLEALRGLGYAVTYGSLGENLTVRGIDFRQLRSGMRFRAGQAVIELTTLRTPCANLDIFNSEGLRIQHELYDSRCKAGDATSPRWARGGFYASVLQPGWIQTGDILELAEVAV